MNTIRNSTKAIIIRDGKLLCTKNADDFGVFYLLPGGGQEPGETLHEALKRECMEEISAQVDIGDILFVRDYIGKNHEFSKWDSGLHQVEYMFSCSLSGDCEPKSGAVPDSRQIGVEWLDIKNFKEYRLYPAALKDVLDQNGKKVDVVYLGDTN